MSSDIPTIDQMNIEIARFEGRRWVGKYTIDKFGGNTGNALPEMKYHTSWDWLMPVCHKVREMVFELRNNEKAANLYSKLNAQLMYGTLADVHLRVYKIIIWLNQQHTTNE